MHWSYKVGVDGIAKLTKNAKEFTRAATVLGMIVVGALIASYVNVNIVTPEYLSMARNYRFTKYIRLYNAMFITACSNIWYVWIS